jgi:hypothetical protein
MNTENEIGVKIFNNHEVPFYSEIDGHFAPVPMFVGNEILKDLPFSVAAVEISKKVGQPIAALHKHDQAEIYLVPSPGLEFDVITDKGKVTVESPSVIVIPANTPHQFIVKSCEYSPCYIMGIFTKLKNS